MSAPYPTQPAAPAPAPAAAPAPAQPEYPGQVPPTQTYPPPPPPMNNTVIVSQPGVMVAGQQRFTTHDPVTVTCPTCHQTVQTRVDHETGLITWAAMGGIFIIGCWAGCCLIPLCINELKDARHSCPNCTSYLGTYKVLS